MGGNDTLDGNVFGDIGFADITPSASQREEERFYHITHWSVMDFPVQHTVVPSPVGGSTTTVQAPAVAMTENGIQVKLP